MKCTIKTVLNVDYNYFFLYLCIERYLFWKYDQLILVKVEHLILKKEKNKYYSDSYTI